MITLEQSVHKVVTTCHIIITLSIDQLPRIMGKFNSIKVKNTKEWVSNSTSKQWVWIHNFKIAINHRKITMALNEILGNNKRRMLVRMDSKWGLEDNLCNKKEAMGKQITEAMQLLGCQAKETNRSIKESIESRAMDPLFLPISSWPPLVNHTECRCMDKLFHRKMLRIQGKLDNAISFILSFINL